MALARTDRIQSVSAASHGTGSFSTGAFTPANDSLLVVFVHMMGNNTSNDLGQPTISGGGWTYTFRGEAHLLAAWSTRLNVFTAPVTTGASMTITVDDDDNQNIYGYQVGVIEFTGHDTTTPIAGLVGSGTTNIGDGTETQTLGATPTTDDISILTCGMDSDNQPALPTLASGWTKSFDSGTASGGGVLYQAHRESSTSTTVTVTDVYTAAPSFFKGQMISFIVKAAAAGGDPEGSLIAGKLLRGGLLVHGVLTR